MRKQFTFLGLAFLAGALLLRGAWAQDVLHIQYNERPPYQVWSQAGVGGLTAGPITKALAHAGIAHEWEKVPTNRQLALIKANAPAVCGVGWFQTPERLKFAKFSRPVYRDRPAVLLVRPGFVVGERATLEALLGRPGVRVLVKDNYSYGAFIDALIARLQPVLVKTTSENAAMAAMVRMERADFMFMSEEEAPVAIREAALAPKDLMVVRTPDMPKGEPRYLMCSQSVSDELLERFNHALVKVVGSP